MSIDFQGAKITSNTGFLLIREIDQRFNILSGPASQIDDPRSHRHTDHAMLQLLRQRVYQVAAGYDDCNDANHLRVDPALRLALGKEHGSGASQSALCRFENKILATGQGLKALENAISRSADTLLRRRNKRRLIIDVDSTEDPVHGNQEGAAFNGYSHQVCYHPLFCLTNKGDLLSARLRPGNAHSADGVLDLISPLVERYRSWFKQFGCGGMRLLPVQTCMSFVKRSESLISFVFRPTTA
ncbi:MAG: transposase [Syntrophobacteraceae bacterium]